MRRLVLAVLLVSSGAAARTVIHADDTGASIDVVAVQGELAGAVATFRVRYVATVETPGYGSLIETLELPATALVTAATVRRDGVAHRLGLVRAEDAKRKWGELANGDQDEDQAARHAAAARRAAVLIEGGPGSVTVSMASPRAGRVELELELAMQTCFFRDARYVVVPATWAGHTRGGPRTVAKPSDELAAACTFTTDGVWLAFPAPEVARRRSGDRIGAFAGRLVAGEDHFVRVEVDLAAMLADIPHDLATVLVVDGSRSMTIDEREAQRELVVSYLRKAGATRVQVIAFARTARPLLPSWTAASRAVERVDRELRALAPRNGSNLDVGLAEAGAWLERIEGTRRVVLVTDDRMASRLQETQPATLKRALPAGTLVHVASAGGGGGGVTRDDGTVLAPLAAATDGISVRVQKGDDRTIDATMLVRPISIDQLVVTAPGWTQLEPSTELAVCGAPSDVDLGEGRACSWWGHGDVTSGPVAIAGLVWGRRITRVLRPDPLHGLEVARELSIASTSFEPALKERLDKMARGVNAQWSMYGEWGGTGGYFEGFGIGISGGCCGGASSSTIDHVGIGTLGVRNREPENLSAQLAPAVAACKLEGATARADIEMTMLEIVDVVVRLDGRSRTDPNDLRRLQTCIEDAIWDASPMLARPLAHSTHVATFGAP